VSKEHPQQPLTSDDAQCPRN